MSSTTTPNGRLYVVGSTTMPSVFHSTYDRWMEYIVNERAAARAVCDVRRHLRLCDWSALAHSIQDKRKQ
jgi:hypothetical protein